MRCLARLDEEDHHRNMNEVSPLPLRGDVLMDARDNGRELRVSWHDDADFVVLSLWRDGVCAATFRLAKDQVPALVNTLVVGLLPGRSQSRGVQQQAS